MSHLNKIAGAVAKAGIDFKKGLSSSEAEMLVADIASTANLESDAPLDVALAPIVLGKQAFSEDAKLPSGIQRVGMQGLSEDPDVNLEHFTLPRTDVTVASTFAYNTFGAKQDDYMEALFPTYINDPKYRTIKVVVETTYVIDAYQVTDTTYESILENKRSIIGLMNDADNSPFAEDKLKLIPVSTTETSQYLATDYTISVKSPLTGADVSTSPLKAGVKIPLGYVAQDQVLLSRGVLNNTDILDDTVYLQDLYLMFTATDANGNKIPQPFQYKVRDYQGTKWRLSQTGDQHDIEIVFNKTVSIPVQQWKLIDGSANTAFLGFSTSLNAKVDLQIVGSGNLRTKEFTISVTKFELVGATDATGVIDPTSKVYTDLVAAWNTLDTTKYGVTIDARYRNDNRRLKGLYITSQGWGSVFGVRAKTPYYTKAPVGGLNEVTGQGEMNDGGFMKELITAQKAQNRQSGYSTFLRFVRDAREVYATTNDPLAIEWDGPATSIISPYFKRVDMNMAQYLDSLTNSGRKEDIKASLVDLLAQEHNEMINVSKFQNFIDATDYAYELVINAGNKFRRFLGESVDLNGKVAKVRYTNEIHLRDSIFITYRPATINKEKIDPFGFGFFTFTPSVVSESVRAVDGTEVSVLLVNPIYEHVITNPVVTEVSVTGLDLAIQKITVNTHAL